MLTGGFANEAQEGIHDAGEPGNSAQESATGAAEPCPGILDVGAAVFTADMLTPRPRGAASIVSKQRQQEGKQTLHPTEHWTTATATARLGAHKLGLRLSEIVAAADVAPKVASEHSRAWGIATAAATAQASENGGKTLSTVVRMGHMRMVRGIIAQRHAAGVSALRKVAAGTLKPSEWPPRDNGRSRSAASSRRGRGSRNSTHRPAPETLLPAVGSGAKDTGGGRPASPTQGVAKSHMAVSAMNRGLAEAAKYRWRDEAGIPRRHAAGSTGSSTGLPVSLARRRAQRQTAKACREIIRNARYKFISSAARKQAEAAAKAQEQQGKRSRCVLSLVLHRAVCTSLIGDHGSNRYKLRMKEAELAVAARDQVQALAAWEGALEVARELKSHKLAIAALENMGVAAAVLPGRPGAVKYLQEAISLARQHAKSRPLLAGLLDALGRVLLLEGSAAQSAQCHLEQLVLWSVECVKDASKWKHKAKALQGYTQTLMSVGLWDQARWALGVWLDLAKSHKDRAEEAKAHGLTGVAHMREGFMTDAVAVRFPAANAVLPPPPPFSHLAMDCDATELRTRAARCHEGSAWRFTN